MLAREMAFLQLPTDGEQVTSRNRSETGRKEGNTVMMRITGNTDGNRNGPLKRGRVQSLAGCRAEQAVRGNVELPQRRKCNAGRK